MDDRNHLAPLCAVSLALALLCSTAVHSETLTAGDLRLDISEQARVTGISIADTKLKITPGPLLTLCDVSLGKFHEPSEAAGDLQHGLELRFNSLRATVVLSALAAGGALHLNCGIVGDPGPARGMLLRFALPIDAVGWQWYRDIQDADRIAEGRRYEFIEPLRAWADLPEWKDQADLRMGYSNRNFCTVIAGPVGLCLALPIDKPCLARTAYDASRRSLEVVYDFALSPDARMAHEAEFAFDLYTCDPQWGFRSALARYYELYPDLFEVCVKDPGPWMAFSRLSEIDNANEFCFRIQEGAPEPAYDDKLGVLSTVYFTHAGMGANLPEHDPEKDPLPPHDVQVAAVEKAFKQRTGIDGLFQKVGLFNAEGKLDVRPWRVYAHLIAQFNLDPDLPYGEWTLTKALETITRIAESQNAQLDGFYYDGLSAGVNYRADHFATADFPCLWDPVAGKPALNNFFSSCEFARAAAELLRPRGRITMMNGALGASFYVAPWLDVLGAETGVRIPRNRLNYIRSITRHKPFLTLLKGNFEQQLGHEEIKTHMEQCLAYGIPPGLFDWMPSGLGPGGRYWDHPRYYERDRALFRKYQPLCSALAAAGWEPVTYARTSQPKVFVERFGPTTDGIIWLSLLNEDKQDLKTTVEIDPEQLQLKGGPVRAVEVVAERPVHPAESGDTLQTELEMPAGGVRVLQITRPMAAARWRIAQALGVLDRGIRMRQLDVARPALPVHWRPAAGTVSRDSSGGKTNLVLRGDKASAVSASQWVMLFQSEAKELKLRVRAKGENISGQEGTASIVCRLARVTPSFTHYESRQLDLPSGTYDWKDFELPIRSAQPLRAIQVTPQLAKGAQGALHLAAIGISDAGTPQYVADPEFAEWYEPLPAELRPLLDENCLAIRTELLRLQDAPGPEGIAAIDRRIQALRETIARAKAENGCRRVLRDLETVEHHLNQAL